MTGRVWDAVVDGSDEKGQCVGIALQIFPGYGRNLTKDSQKTNERQS